MTDHHLHGRMLMADAVRSIPDFVSEHDIPAFDENERARLDESFGAYGEKSWTGMSIHKRVAAVAHLWGATDQEREGLYFYTRVVHRENNQLLHISGHAVSKTIVSSGPKGLHVKIGPGPEHVAQALAAAIWVFREVIDLVLRHFDVPRRSEFERLCERLITPSHDQA